MQMMKAAEESKTSKDCLTGQEELSTKPCWYLGCCLTPLLLSRLRAWDPGKKEREIYEVGPVTSHKTDSSSWQFKVPKGQPCSNAPLLPLPQREPEKSNLKQAQLGQVWVLWVSSLLHKCCWSVGITFPRSQISCVCPQTPLAAQG